MKCGMPGAMIRLGVVLLILLGVMGACARGSMALPLPAPKVAKQAVPSSVEKVRLCILHRESRGNYRIVSRESYRGIRAYGGYQFQDATWFHVTHLRGHASDYPKAVQDAAFLKLYANGKGRSNWFWRGNKQCW